MFSFLVGLAIVGFFGLLFTLFLCMASISSRTKEEEILFERAICVVGGFSVLCLLIGIGAVVYDARCGVKVTNLGVGQVVRLNNSVGKHSVTTHTVVRLNGMNYTCYGYVPDAKEVAVIETKHIVSEHCSYTCELPE